MPKKKKKQKQKKQAKQRLPSIFLLWKNYETFIICSHIIYYKKQVFKAFYLYQIIHTHLVSYKWLGYSVLFTLLSR